MDFGAQLGRGAGATEQEDLSLLDLLQQQAALAKQQQQRRQPQAQAEAPGLDVPLATLLAQQNAAAAAAGGGGGGFPGFHSQPLGVPQTGEFLQAPGMPPNFLPIDFGQQQQQRAGGALPPAILQHQQAALAQQAAAPPMPAGMPPVSGAGFDATRPSWAAQAASVPLPTFPLPFGVPTDSAATAGAAAAAAGNAASGAQPATRRRGRQPRDPSTLTEKQLRAREAQKRFREKQKRQMAEAEEAMGATAAELERLRVSNESQKLKHQVLERLLEHNEAQVHVLELQKQMDPPPRFVISADMVDMMRREGIAGLFTPEVLLRYAVSGDTEHMDERGEVKEPPPFEKVAADWADMVGEVRHILEKARQGGAAPPANGVGRPPPVPAASNAASVPPGARRARPSEVVELNSTASGSTSSVDLGSQGGGDEGTSAAPVATAVAGEAVRLSGGAREQRHVSFDHPQSLANSGGVGIVAGGSGSLDHATSGMGRQPDTTALHAAAAQGSGGATSAVSGGSSCSERKRGAPVTHVPENVTPEVVAIAEQAPDEVLEATEAKNDPIARFVLARILSQSAAHSHLQWDTLVDGATVHDGPDTYYFTGHQLCTLAALMRRAGTLFWQQAVLFPEHVTKLGSLRLDDPRNLHVEEQDLKRWRDILRRLHCRREQLERILAGHQRFMARMGPVLAERAEALDEVQRVMAAQLQSAWGPTKLDGTNAEQYLTLTTRLFEATGLVMQTVSAQHAAYCELLLAIFYALTFPVQRPQLFVLSWPYFPQLQLLGQAAALELGVDVSTYPTHWDDDLDDLEGAAFVDAWLDP